MYVRSQGYIRKQTGMSLLQQLDYQGGTPQVPLDLLDTRFFSSLLFHLFYFI
ncbi:hypothetical protein LINGRAHAP2_LOCUS10800 [Linum grandiflorum]